MTELCLAAFGLEFGASFTDLKGRRMDRSRTLWFAEMSEKPRSSRPILHGNRCGSVASARMGASRIAGGASADDDLDTRSGPERRRLRASRVTIHAVPTHKPAKTARPAK